LASYNAANTARKFSYSKLARAANFVPRFLCRAARYGNKAYSVYTHYTSSVSGIKYSFLAEKRRPRQRAENKWFLKKKVWTWIISRETEFHWSEHVPKVGQQLSEIHRPALSDDLSLLQVAKISNFWDNIYVIIITLQTR